MLENYIVDKNGVIKQINIGENIDYNENYVLNSYIKYGELSNYISYLRYGYLIASIEKTPHTILDFGYGSGAFLDVCKINIPNCYGYDIGDFNVPDGCKRIDNIFSRHFDVVTFFDSLEHVNDIYFLDKINCDYIMISVPECHYFSDDWFNTWKHRRKDEHLWHFSKKSLINFMLSQGFCLINISNIEDNIRKPVDNFSNILTGVFKKIKL
jgi:hypothetical protein